MKSQFNSQSIDLLKMLETIRKRNGEKVFKESETDVYFSLLIYLIEQLDLSYWSDHFKRKKLDKYFFQTIGISLTANKKITIAQIYFLWSRESHPHPYFQIRGLDTLIKEVTAALNGQQIQEISKRVQSLLVSLSDQE